MSADDEVRAVEGRGRWEVRRLEDGSLRFIVYTEAGGAAWCRFTPDEARYLATLLNHGANGLPMSPVSGGGPS